MGSSHLVEEDLVYVEDPDPEISQDLEASGYYALVEKGWGGRGRLQRSFGGGGCGLGEGGSLRLLARGAHRAGP